MKEFAKKHKQLLIDIAVLAGVFLFIFVAFFVFKPFYFTIRDAHASIDGVVNRIFTYFCLIAIISVGIVLRIKGKLTIHTLLFLIFLLGVTIQLNYMLMTPTYQGQYRQHDVFGDAGHEAYAWTIYSTGKLPTMVDESGHLAYQFYHPPLNAFVQAIFMHICKPFVAMFSSNYYDPNNTDCLFQTTEILSTFYMSITTYFGIKIAYKLKVDDKFKVTGALFVALFPALIILAGQVNNDPLCIMNCFIVIYFSIRWWENRSYFNACMIGLFTGLAMMAKLSGALIIVPAIVAFAIVLIQQIIKKENVKHTLFQGSLIALIAAPLGLWFHVYAKIKFNQPFGFVFSNLTSELYTGDYSFFARFINIFDFKDMFSGLWGNTFENYNVPNFLIKSALFGEYTFAGVDGIAILSLIFNYLFVYMSLVLMVIYFIYSKKEHFEVKIIAGTLIISQLIAQLYFNIKMPYGCTMDFRYIVPIIIGFMILDVLAIDKFSKEKDWKEYYAWAVFIVGVLLITSTTSFYFTFN